MFNHTLFSISNRLRCKMLRLILRNFKIWRAGYNTVAGIQPTELSAAVAQPSDFSKRDKLDIFLSASQDHRKVYEQRYSIFRFHVLYHIRASRFRIKDTFQEVLQHPQVLLLVELVSNSVVLQECLSRKILLTLNTVSLTSNM